MKEITGTTSSQSFTMELSATSSETKQGEATRMVALRYFLDRPGYSIENSSSRLWKNPPATCTPEDISRFLHGQGIRDETDTKLLAEVYLDKFGSYMLLEMCDESGVQFNFANTSVLEPGVLNIRLTDTRASSEMGKGADNVTHPKQICNTSPIGIFAFSMTLALESTHGLMKLGGTVDESFDLTWGPWAFFVSGLLQLIVGILEVTRNNIYGATAFLAFGCFWMANGLKLILINYRPSEIPLELLGDDPTGNCLRNLWILGFVCVLFKQTLVMNKVTSLLIGLLAVQVVGSAFAGWSLAMEWMQMIMGLVVAVFAFYIFTAEFTNEVYHRRVFNMHPWSTESSSEVFGASGRVNKLQLKAIGLRTARSPSDHHLRAVKPLSNGMTPT